MQVNLTINKTKIKYIAASKSYNKAHRNIVDATNDRKYVLEAVKGAVLQ